MYKAVNLHLFLFCESDLDSKYRFNELPQSIFSAIAKSGISSYEYSLLTLVLTDSLIPSNYRNPYLPQI